MDIWGETICFTLNVLIVTDIIWGNMDSKKITQSHANKTYQINVTECSRKYWMQACSSSSPGSSTSKQKGAKEKAFPAFPLAHFAPPNL